MTKRRLPPAKAWTEREITDWNTTTFHAYLTDRNRELFRAEYVPFGKGPISNRWRTEQGQLRHAIDTHGQVTVKAFIDRCLAKHRPTANFPHINFGFMWAYMRDELARAIADIERKIKSEFAKRKDEGSGWDSDWV